MPDFPQAELPRFLQRRLKRHVKNATHDFFAVCALGFEAVLERELLDLKKHLDDNPSTQVIEEIQTNSTNTTSGGVLFTGQLDALYYTHLHLRTAHRILWRIESDLLAQSYPMLFEKVRKLPWEHYLGIHPNYHLQVSSKTSRLNHKQGIANTLSQAIAKRLEPLQLTPQASPKDATPEPILIQARLLADRCTLSVNTSGTTHLHKRGYRILNHHAPIRETLAAAILQWLELPKYDTLLDPMCGSGTFLIEAARMARGLPAPILNPIKELPQELPRDLPHNLLANPPTPRTFGFYHLPTFQASKWQHLSQPATPFPSPTNLEILGGDIDANALELTHAHAHYAQVANNIVLEQQEARAWLSPTANKNILKDDVSKPHRTLICLNAPYGKRLGTPDAIAKTLNNLHKTVQNSRQPNHHITLAILTSPNIANRLKHSGTESDTENVTSKHFKNGGLPVVLTVFAEL